VQIAGSQGRIAWTTRVKRAEELAHRNPWATQVLGFYVQVLVFQGSLFDKFRAGNASSGQNDLRMALDIDAAARSLPELADVVAKHGPSVLAKRAEQLRSSSPQQRRDLVEGWLLGSGNSDGGSAFFARVLLQPQAACLVELGGFALQKLAENRCPHCGSRPQLAVLRPEGDGGKRLLLCSLCNSEWEFRRILCPACGEENHEKLPRFTAADIAAVRIEACDNCQHYLKSVDLTVDGLAVPVVDEIATAPLDLWAAEHNYTKIQVNIVGF
jgi:FdhE protein